MSCAVGEVGDPVHGWARQFELLADNVSAALPLHRRVPQLMWRGRVSLEWRDELRRQFVECQEVCTCCTHRPADCHVEGCGRCIR